MESQEGDGRGAPRVEYELTDLGRTLLPAIAALTTWAEKHGAAVIEALDGHGALDGAGGSGDAPGAGEAPTRASARPPLPCSAGAPPSALGRLPAAPAALFAAGGGCCRSLHDS